MRRPESDLGAKGKAIPTTGVAGGQLTWLKLVFAHPVLKQADKVRQIDSNSVTNLLQLDQV